MQLGDCVTQHVVVLLYHLLVEMLNREAAANVTIQPQHSFNLGHRSAPQRRCQPPVGEPGYPGLAMAIAPTTKGSFTDPKPFRRVDLA
jgi:hypothetical protein